MNHVEKRIEIDLYSPTSYEVIHAQQGDNLSRVVEFILYDQGTPYQLPDHAAIYLEGHRGDHTFFAPKACTTSGNVITATLDSDILYEPGTAEAKIVLYDSDTDTVLSTIPFTISVQKNPCDKNKIESEKSSVIDWLVLNFNRLKKAFESHISDHIAHLDESEHERLDILTNELLVDGNTDSINGLRTGDFYLKEYN